MADNASPFYFPPLWEPAALEWDEDIARAFQSETPGGMPAAPYCRSPASEVLVSELRRYVGRRMALPRGPSPSQTESGTSEDDSRPKEPKEQPRPRTYGRSVLLSGLRGTGKTATVYWAIREVQSQLLDGPSVRLLPVLITASTFLGDGSSGAASYPSDRHREREPRFRLLIELCGTLHRAVIREFLRSIRRRLLEQEHVVRATGKGSSDYQIRDRFEMLAQLEQDFEDFVSPAKLREYWRRLGFLEGDSTALFARPKKEDPSLQLPTFQAIEEVSLLTTLNELYLRVAGKIFRESSQTEEAFDASGDAKNPQRIFDPTEWRTIIAALLGGTAAGSGMATTGPNGVPALLAGTLGAVVMGWIASRFPVSTEQTQVSRSERFSKNYSLETLHLEIPRMIDELTQVGLFPVFIIDELDKVPNIYGKMSDLLRHLKQVFAQDGFFCFLTNREFLDDLNDREGKAPYAISSTWFSNRVFAEYHLTDLRKFVSSGIRPVAEGRRESDATQDWERSILPFILLFEGDWHIGRVLRARNRFQAAYERQDLKSGDLLADAGESGESAQLEVPRKRFALQSIFGIVAELTFDEFFATEAALLRPGELQVVQRGLLLPGQTWRTGRDLALLLDGGLDSSIDKIEQELLDAAPGNGRPGTNAGVTECRLLSAGLRQRIELALQYSHCLLQNFGSSDTAEPTDESAPAVKSQDQSDSDTFLAAIQSSILSDSIPVQVLDALGAFFPVVDSTKPDEAARWLFLWTGDGDPVKPDTPALENRAEPAESATGMTIEQAEQMLVDLVDLLTPEDES